MDSDRALTQRWPILSPKMFIKYTEACGLGLESRTQALPQNEYLKLERKPERSYNYLLLDPRESPNPILKAFETNGD